MRMQHYVEFICVITTHVTINIGCLLWILILYCNAAYRIVFYWAWIIGMRFLYFFWRLYNIGFMNITTDVNLISIPLILDIFAAMCHKCSRDFQYWGGCIIFHDDVIKWKHCPGCWPFVRGIHRSPVNSPHKGQWRGASMFSLICVAINGWVNNREAGDLRRYRAHFHVTVM